MVSKCVIKFVQFHWDEAMLAVWDLSVTVKTQFMGNKERLKHFIKWWWNCFNLSTALDHYLIMTLGGIA